MTARRAAAVACAGTLLIDAIGVVDRLPGEDERVESSASTIAAGGNAANSAITMARLGVDVDFIGIVGDDAMGRSAVAALEAEGVGTSAITIDDSRPTASSLVVVCRDNGTRTIVTQPAAIPVALPQGYEWLHVDKCGYTALRRTGGSASQVSLDDGNPVPDLELALVDLYVPTVATLAVRYPDLDPHAAARAAMEAGAGTVVATAGAQGSFAVSESQTVFACALPITPISSLGAGDVFHGALVAALVLGKELTEATRFANVTAALACLALDGHSGVPDRATVEAHLDELPRSPHDVLESIRGLHA